MIGRTEDTTPSSISTDIYKSFKYSLLPKSADSELTYFSDIARNRFWWLSGQAVKLSQGEEVGAVIPGIRQRRGGGGISSTWSGLALAKFLDEFFYNTILLSMLILSAS